MVLLELRALTAAGPQSDFQGALDVSTSEKGLSRSYRVDFSTHTLALATLRRTWLTCGIINRAFLETK